MIFKTRLLSSLQHRLDETAALEDYIPDEVYFTDTAPPEEPFTMAGLYEVIPGVECEPIRIDSWQPPR